MRSPKTFEEFKTLIYDMTPRDRYVFESNDPNEEEGALVEVYLTLVIDDNGVARKNLFYQFTDELGKHRLTVDPEKATKRGKPLPQGAVYREGMNKGNKRLSLVTDSYLETIYSWLKK